MIGVVLVLAATTGALDAMVKAATACPKVEITVCGRRDAVERSRYRSPLPLDYEPGDPRARSVSAARNGLFDYDAGGVGTCSSVGPGGASGCGFQRHKRWALQKAGAPDGRGPLFAK